MDEKTEVLIIEDDSDIRNTIRILLECEGFEVREASSGEEGLKMMSPQTELVILDVMMPGMSGYETCENIRKFSYVPILFLTAKKQGK
jgi:DNA-binding response OmpR family regulator